MEEGEAGGASEDSDSGDAHAHMARRRPEIAESGERWLRELRPDPYRVTFAEAPIGLAHMAPNGALLTANDRMCEIVGYPREELTTLSFQDITYPEDLAIQLPNVQRMLAGELDRYQMEKRYVRKNGEIEWVQLTVSIVRDDATGAPLFFIKAVEEIGARKRAELALRASDQRCRSLLECVKDHALFLLDADGLVVSSNPGVQSMLGWDDAAITGRHFRRLFTPEDQAAGVPEQLLTTAARDDRAVYDRRQIRRDGSWFIGSGVVHAVRDEGTHAPVGYSLVLADATQRHEYEQRLAQKAALIDLASDAILVQEPYSNRIAYWSRGAESAYGWTREEALGRVAGDLLRTEFPAGLDRATVLAALLQNGRWEGDLTQTTRDGRQIIVASRWALQRDPQDGHPLAVLEVNRDVTETRQREAAHREEAAQQRQIAEALQRSLLKSPPPDAFPGVTFKALYQSADDDALVGGDWFDVFSVSEDRIALVVGDATGSGINAALHNAEIRFALRAFLREYSHAAVALGRLNAFVCERDRLDSEHLGDSYLALALCVLNTRSGELVCSWAGIEPPFIVRADTGAIEDFAACGGPLLGVDRSLRYTEQRAELRPGDVVALFTDGLTEARRGSGSTRTFFGYEGVEQAIREETRRTASLADAGQAVIERVRRFAGDVVRDDVCLLLARRSSHE